MNILIISHGYRKSNKIGGPPHDIRDFLLNKVDRIDFIVHPFTFANFKQSFMLHYEKGEIKNIYLSSKIKGPEWWQYFQHFFITILFILRNLPRYDICFALDDLSVLSVLIFKKLGLIKKLIYYSIDYTTRRFKNPILNRSYYWADEISCKSSDLNWVVAKHAIEARKENGLDIKKCSPFVEVPIGFHRKEIKIIPAERVDKFHLIFVGSLAEKQGLQIVIKSLPVLISIFPKIHLTIIGTGNYKNALKKLVEKYRLKKKVLFRGFIENHRKIEKLLAKAGIGLAPYKPEPASITYYADPGKIKLYLGCGLPIITTNIPAISKIIKNKKAGEVIPYKEEKFVGAVQKIIQNKKTYKSYKKAAILLSENYDVEKILEKSINKIL
jgi:glycosyltransferase involved in cell wall biosynthesis